jgi:AMMECR1 domain-containing protein
LEVASPQQYLDKLTHQDGVILVNGRHSATYLPQVWEQLPETEQFLSQLCLKGGAQPDCWQDPETQVYTYRAQEFGEE